MTTVGAELSHPVCSESVGRQPASFPDHAETNVASSASQSSWARYASTAVIESETKRFRTCLPWSPEQSLGFHKSPSDVLSDFLRIPNHFLGEMSRDPGPVIDQVEPGEIKERLRIARHVRVSRSDDDIRDVSISKLQKIILIEPEATRLGELLVPSRGKPLDEREIRRSIDQAFSQKSSGTLYKRACALSRYIEWYHRLNRAGSPLRL